MLEIINVICDWYGIEEVVWDEFVVKVVYGYSVDMKKNDYFDYILLI